MLQAFAVIRRLRKVSVVNRWWKVDGINLPGALLPQ